MKMCSWSKAAPGAQRLYGGCWQKRAESMWCEHALHQQLPSSIESRYHDKFCYPVADVLVAQEKRPIKMVLPMRAFKCGRVAKQDKLAAQVSCSMDGRREEMSRSSFVCRCKLPLSHASNASSGDTNIFFRNTVRHRETTGRWLAAPKQSHKYQHRSLRCQSPVLVPVPCLSQFIVCLTSGPNWAALINSRCMDHMNLSQRAAGSHRYNITAEHPEARRSEQFLMRLANLSRTQLERIKGRQNMCPVGHTTVRGLIRLVAERCVHTASEPIAGNDRAERGDQLTE